MRACRPYLHVVRNLLVLAVIAVGWLAIVGNSAEPDLEPAAGDAWGKVKISLGVSGCLPVVSTDKPVHRVVVRNTHNSFMAEVRCNNKVDCLTSVNWHEWGGDAAASCTVKLAPGADLGGGADQYTCAANNELNLASRTKSQCEGDYWAHVETAAGETSGLAYNLALTDQSYFCNMAP